MGALPLNVRGSCFDSQGEIIISLLRAVSASNFDGVVF